VPLSLTQGVRRPGRAVPFLPSVQAPAVPMRSRIANYRSLSRLQAAAIHLAASVFGTGMVALLTLLVWYPGELAQLGGVLHILMLVVVVDVVLGPVITFIVFDTRKPELARDLLIVAALQLAALGYGAQTVFAGRPVYLAFNAERLDLVYAPDIAKENLARGEVSGHGRLPLFGPKLVAAVMPADPAAAAKVVTDALRGGDDIQYLPEHYRPIESQKQSLLAALRPLESLKAANPKSTAEVDTLLRDAAARPAGAGYLPLVSSGDAAVAVFDRASAELLDIRLLRSGAK